MQGWRVVLLMNMALVGGFAAGYLTWGAKLATADATLNAEEAQVGKAARERDACLAGGRAGDQLWEGRGVVRAVYPRLAIVTHEEIAGMLPARTTSFRLSETLDRELLKTGEPIRFWLLGPGLADTALVRAERW